jgi:glycosyltransferase involved in cell wall biosynthesis/GT2 family glycosyltransferase
LSDVEQAVGAVRLVARIAATATPRVAVVIPCFNDGRFLGEALASVAAQEPVELVIVDDGSTDADTLELLAALHDAGGRVLRRGNGGLAAARMTGVRAVTSRYVQVLDADDILPAGVLTPLADALEEDPGASAAWGDIEAFGAYACRFPRARQLDPWRISLINEMLGTSMFRREDLLAIGGWQLRSSYEDWDLWMRAAEAGWRGVHVGRVVLRYRQHQELRLSTAGMSRHAELRAALARRHPELHARRAEHRRRSPSPWPIKLAFSLIEALPGLGHHRRQQLFALARHYVEPEMDSDGFRGARRRVRELLARRRPERPARIGVYFDGVYRTDAGRLYTSAPVLPFLHFVAQLGSHFEQLVVLGRHTDDVDAAPHVVEHDMELARLPYYRDLTRLHEVLAATPGTIRAGWRAMDEVDTLLLFGPHPMALVLAAVARLRGRRVVLGSREDTMTYFENRLPGPRWRPVLAPLRLVDAAFKRLARRWPAVVVGDHLEQRFGGPRPGLLRFGVSLVRERDVMVPPRQRPWTAPVTLLSVGRVEPEKNPLLLVEALRLLDERHPGRYHLEVVGTGRLQDELRRRADELGVGDAVTLAGFVPFGPGLLERYRRADVVVHTALTEAFGQVLVEAMASATPLVATAVGGVPALVGPDAGLLVPAGDAVAIAEAVERLEAPEQRQALLAGAHEVARDHTLERTAQAVATFVRGAA